MFTALIFNNFIELLAIAMAVWLGYGLGRFVEKRWPNRHLRPWKWHINRNS